MLYTSNNKNVKRESDLKSALIIVSIIAIGMIALKIWGDLS
jgi:plastocyanin domain-containing protein